MYTPYLGIASIEEKYMTYNLKETNILNQLIHVLRSSITNTKYKYKQGMKILLASGVNVFIEVGFDMEVACYV